MRIGLDSLFEYGNHKHSLLGNLKNIFTAFTVILIWTIIATVFLTVVVKMDIGEIRALLVAHMDIYSKIPKTLVMNTYFAFFLSCVLAPLWEEAAFRYGPLGVARALEAAATQKTSGYLPKTICLLPMIILSSVVFGLVHGTVINIMFQGVGGLLMAWVMIKSGYWSAVITHSLWNFMVMFGIPVIIQTIK